MALDWLPESPEEDRPSDMENERKLHQKATQGPQGSIRALTFARSFSSNLRSVREMYRGMVALLDPSTRWSTSTLARVAWKTDIVAARLFRAGERAMKLSKYLGDLHGYTPDGAPDKAVFKTTPEAWEYLKVNGILPPGEGQLLVRGEEVPYPDPGILG